MIKKKVLLFSFLTIFSNSYLFANALDRKNLFDDEIIVTKGIKKKIVYEEPKYNIKNYSVPRDLFYTKVKQFYLKTKDLKYKMGGEGKYGTIDCSAFIRKFYEDEFKVSLSRSTHTQVYEGIPIDRNELKIGDLIFFKEKNRVSNHVGIYIGAGKMIHSSSTRKGIGIDDVSKFDNIYWTSRRVLDINS